ncbi:MAG: M24 family metallopeptidase [Mangrovibacterium sp.]
MNNSQSLAEDLALRRERLQAVMQQEGLEACILTTSVNIFYLVGEIYTGYLYLPCTGEPIHFVKRPVDLSLTNVIAVQKPEQIPEALRNRGLSLPPTVLLETDVLPYNSCLRLLNMLGLREARNASVLLRILRKVKTPYEIEQTRICARQHVKVYEAVPSLYRTGMTDIELQIEVEHWMRQHGSLGIFRSYGENMDIHMGSLLSGENAEIPSPYDFALGGQGVSPVLPLGASGSPIKEGQAVMVDMAGNYTPWMTDITRVYARGKISEAAYRAHQVSLEIHQAILEKTGPGSSCSVLYDLAMELTRKNKLEPYFMGTRQQAKFVGHGVGLEINEPPVLTPRSKEELEPGIVFALEPKYVIPGVGAVGIENTYLVTPLGLEKLTEVEENIVEL